MYCLDHTQFFDSGNIILRLHSVLNRIAYTILQWFVCVEPKIGEGQYDNQKFHRECTRQLGYVIRSKDD